MTVLSKGMHCHVLNAVSRNSGCHSTSRENTIPRVIMELLFDDGCELQLMSDHRRIILFFQLENLIISSR